MKRVCVWIALSLTFPPMGFARAHNVQSLQRAEPPAQKSPPPPAVLGSKDERVENAASFYDKGRFVEAALEFEGLAKDFPQEPSFLFNAAVSRFGAGHHAHTIVNTRAYLTRKDLQPDDRKEAEAQLADALRKVVPIRVTIRAPAGGPPSVTVVAQHIARSSSDLRPELLFPLTLSEQTATAQLDLDPGAWTLRVQGPRYEQQERRVELAQGTPGAVEFALAFVPASETFSPQPPPAVPEVPSTAVRAMKLGFATAGGVAVLAGIVVPLAGAVRVKRLDVGSCETTEMDAPYATCRTAWKAAYRTRDAGLAVLGSGLGLLGGGLTWLVRDPRKRRSAFIAETAIGGLLLVGGFASLFATTRPFNELNEAGDWKTQHDKIAGRVGPHAVSMTAFGLGLGLLTSAAVGLGVQRKYTGSLRAGALTGPGQAGLLLSGSF